MIDLLTLTPDVAERTRPIYDRVANVITTAEWDLFAPYVDAINRLKRERNVRRRLPGDAPLALGVPNPLVPERQLVGHGVRDGAAVGARQEPLLLEYDQVAADRGR